MATKKTLVRRIQKLETRAGKQSEVIRQAREVSMKAQQVAKSAASIVETMREGLMQVDDEKVYAQSVARLKKQSKALEPMQQEVEDVWYRLDKDLKAKMRNWKWQ